MYEVTGPIARVTAQGGAGMSDLRVGLLAYGAIGHEHNLAVQATPGLVLAAVCDTNPERLVAARELAPEAATFTDATEMLDAGLLDLVVVSTPPNSHAHWARQALERGIHVVLEKPMALTANECDDLIALAAAQDLLLIVYQNRRYDRDFVTLARLVNEGVLGEVFQYDCFVGGYSQPCTYWHSDVAVSGGAIFDWGSHFLDQMLTVMPGDVDFVTAMNHKRHWHHVTNADHAQVTVTFADGRQSTFVNSDLAAARRPKFYVLGTLGALVGDWDPAAEPAVADLPAILTLHRPDGSREQIPLDTVADFAFHASLTSRLHDGVAMAVRTEHSRDVVSIMEAAEQSAARNGRPISPALLRT